MSTDDDPRLEQLQQSSQARILTVWERALEALTRLGQTPVAPDRMAYPRTFDEKADEDELLALSQPKQQHLNAHSSLLQFRDELLPYAESYVDEWTATVDTLEDGDRWYSINEPRVTLKNIPTWSQVYVTLERTERSSLHGEQDASRQWRLLLPPQTLRATYRQLLELAGEIGYVVEPQPEKLEDDNVLSP